MAFGEPAAEQHTASLIDRIKDNPLKRLGPGLITGVADDDPSGIATYSQAGAQFGFNMLWTMPLALPLMSAMQLMCANLGRVTGKGLAANIKQTFPPIVLLSVVVLLLIANVLNIAADVAAMGEVAELVSGISRHIMTVVFVVGTVAMQVFIPYHRYVFFLKWLSLALLAYAAVLFVVPIPWHEVVMRTVWPEFAWNATSAAMVVGIFGTTISPYLFFWQASEEVEELRIHPLHQPLIDDPEAAPAELSRIRWDTWTGMLFSNVTAYFVILATAVTLHAAGVTDIATAGAAASALRPLAGNFAYILFAAGILGVGLVGVPVLAGSGAYALAETMGWKEGLENKAGDARGFYLVIAVSVLLAIVIQYLPISPMKALFWSAVINGVVAVPLMVVLLILVSKRSVMGAFTASRSLLFFGGLATLVMLVAALLMFFL